jgi:hypothetical protein
MTTRRQPHCSGVHVTVRDPEKWAPVFGKDHARTKSWSGMMTRPKIISF